MPFESPTLALITLLKKLGYEVFATSRKSQIDDLTFNLEDPETYKNIPPSAQLVWTFPGNRPDLVREFNRFVSKIGSPIRVIIGTTSDYVDQTGVITEDSILKLESPRVQSEEYLRKQ